MDRIHRVDDDQTRTHAWIVRVQRRNRIHQRYFSDSVHGGKRQALATAKAYRETLLRTLPELTRPEVCTIRKKNNRSGVSGVSRHEAPGRTPTSPRHLFWLAQWPIGGGRAKQRKFSIKRYGERGAYLRAIRARRAALRDLREKSYRKCSATVSSKSCTRPLAPNPVHVIVAGLPSIGF